MFVLGDEPGRVSFRGKTGSKTVTRKDAIRALEKAAHATDKQEIYLATLYRPLPYALRAA